MKSQTEEKVSPSGVILSGWVNGDSVDTIVASLKLMGVTKNSGVEISKKSVKQVIRRMLANGRLRKRAVVEKKPGA